MTQRIITAIALIALVAVVVYFGGWVFAVAMMLALCCAIWEEFRAFKAAGHRPITWPTWVGMAASIPVLLLTPSISIVAIFFAALLAVSICVFFREKPELTDILVSVLPLCSVLLPGMCMISVLSVSPKALQVSLLCLMFIVPVLGDTCAFFVGSRVRGPKLCPAVSPNKTISGAIAGLVGSVLGALLVYFVVGWCSAPEDAASLMTLWQYLLIGLVGGVAGQAGDLFASLVKRHCGIKDFSNIFPGHGGMMDRLDSILFASVIVFCFHIFFVA